MRLFDNNNVQQSGTDFTAASGRLDLENALDAALSAYRWVYDAGSTELSYENMYAVNVAAADGTDDLRIGGFERFHVRLGDGDNIVFGGDLDDAVSGGNTFADYKLLLSSVGTRNSEKLSHAGGSLHFNGVEETHISASDAGSVMISGYKLGVLQGSAGQDVMLSLPADDLLQGKSGQDTYVFDSISGNDIVLDERESNTIFMFTDTKQSELSFTNDGTDLVITQSPEFYISSKVRVVGFFDESDAGYNFTFQTINQTFQMDLSYLDAGGSGIPACETEFTGTDDDDSIYASSYVGDRMYLGGGMILSCPAKAPIQFSAASDLMASLTQIRLRQSLSTCARSPDLAALQRAIC